PTILNKFALNSQVDPEDLNSFENELKALESEFKKLKVKDLHFSLEDKTQTPTFEEDPEYAEENIMEYFTTDIISTLLSACKQAKELNASIHIAERNF
ncbi:MAG: hypothetical protein IJZ29_05595, partial [Clostridia bacterium]|nr:hypothetical protein [Clostridia bacterium]